MRISRPEPTFLDMRDAIVTADRQLFPDDDHSGAIWRVFAARGMGWNAASPTQDVVVEGFKRPPTAALGVSPSPAAEGQAVSFDASGSSDPDGRVVSYDFDFQGDGTRELTGTPNPRQSFTYAGQGTFNPVVTVHDDEGQIDTAAKTLQVGAPAAPSTFAAPAAKPTSRAPVIALSRKGTKGRVRFTVRCDSACAGTARLTVTRRLAKQLRLGRRRTVGRVRVRLAAAGKKRFTIRLTKRTLKAMKRTKRRRITTKLAATVTDAERQRAVKRRTARIRR
jgi:hypothetical protein